MTLSPISSLGRPTALGFPATNEGGEKALHAAHSSGRPVHVLCASGARASLAAATLDEMGYIAQPIEGGLKGWREAGRPVEGGKAGST